MLKAGVLIIGLIFIVKGILGFSQEFTSIENNVELLFETFAVNDIVNWIHILTGIAALLSAFYNLTARLFCQVFGIVYAFIAIIGLFQGMTVLGSFQTNMESNLVHFTLAVMMIALGFGIKTPGASQQISTN